MRPERSGRNLAELGLVVRQHVGSSLTRRLVVVGSVAHVRTREVHALGLGHSQEVGVQQPVGSHHHRVLETRHGRSLLDNEVTLGLEDREEQQLGGTGSHLGQHRNHVAVTLVHSREPRDRPTAGLERIGERRGQTLGVGIAVVDRSSSRHAQHVKGEVGSRSTLVKIVVSRAVVAGVVVLARSASQVRRQRRGRVRPRDHHHARSRNKRRRSSRSTGTRRPDHTHHILIRDQDLCRSLPAVSRTQIIHACPDLDIVAADLTVVSHSHTNAVLIGNAQERHITRNGIQRTNLDRLTRTHLDHTQRPVTQMVGNRADLLRSRLGRSSRSHRSRSRSHRSRSRGRRSSRIVVLVGTARSGHQRQCQDKH